MVSRDEEAERGVSQENMRRRYYPGEMLDKRILTGQAGYKVVGLRKVKTPSIEKQWRRGDLSAGQAGKQAFACLNV